MRGTQTQNTDQSTVSATLFQGGVCPRHDEVSLVQREGLLIEARAWWWCSALRVEWDVQTPPPAPPAWVRDRGIVSGFICVLIFVVFRGRRDISLRSEHTNTRPLLSGRYCTESHKPLLRYKTLTRAVFYELIFVFCLLNLCLCDYINTMSRYILQDFIQRCTCLVQGEGMAIEEHTYLPTYPLTYLSAYLPTHLHTYSPTFLPTYRLTQLHT